MANTTIEEKELNEWIPPTDGLFDGPIMQELRAFLKEKTQLNGEISHVFVWDILKAQHVIAEDLTTKKREIELAKLPLTVERIIARMAKRNHLDLWPIELSNIEGTFKAFNPKKGPIIPFDRFDQFVNEYTGYSYYDLASVLTERYKQTGQPLDWGRAQISGAFPSAIPHTELILDMMYVKRTSEQWMLFQPWIGLDSTALKEIISQPEAQKLLEG